VGGFIVKGCCIEFLSEAVPWQRRWEGKKVMEKERRCKEKQRKKIDPLLVQGQVGGP
jgi:hypothetical protein